MKYDIKIGIIGGSGLNNPDILKNPTIKNVTTIFGNPSDVLIEGEIEGVACVLLARHGRNHDIMPGNINYRANIWALKEAGCTHVIASTATGSLQEHIKLGDLVILDSFIDRTHGRKQTFYDGNPTSPQGICHIPMEPAFCPFTRSIIFETAKELGLSVHETGTVVVIEGPRYSSKAESHMYRQWGGDVVTMTAIPEIILAKEAGLCYASIAMATDYDCWKPTGERVSVCEVLKTFKENVGNIIQLITRSVTKIAKEDWDDRIQELRDMVQSNIMLPK